MVYCMMFRALWTRAWFRALTCVVWAAFLVLGGAFWRHVGFYAGLLWQGTVLGKKQFGLASATPFGWERVCLLPDSYRADFTELNALIGVPGFDAARVWGAMTLEPGGFMLFVQKNWVVAVRWNDFTPLGDGGGGPDRCYTSKLEIINDETDGRIKYRMVDGTGGYDVAKEIEALERYYDYWDAVRLRYMQEHEPDLLETK